MSGALRRARVQLATALVAVAVLAPAALAAARWPEYWLWIASEQTPMTWLQSVVLVLAAATCLLAVVVLGLRGAARVDRLPWAVLSCGFAALAFDERFAVHERVRDGYLAPREVRLPLLSWVAPGDFLVLLVTLVGVALLPLVLRALSADRTARRTFLAGVVIAVVAAGVDSIDPSTWSVQGERLQQSLEEVVELAAGLCLLGAVVLRLLGILAPSVPGSSAGAPGQEHDQLVRTDARRGQEP